MEKPTKEWTGRKKYIPEVYLDHPTVKLLYNLIKKLETNQKIIQLLKLGHTNAWISKLFGDKSGRYVYRIVNGDICSITSERMKILINNLEQMDYINEKILTKARRFLLNCETANSQDNYHFLRDLKIELDNVHVSLTPTKASEILYGSKYRIRDYLKKFKNFTKGTYQHNSDYYFDLDTLDDLKLRFETLLGEQAKELIKILEIYKKLFNHNIRPGVYHNIGNKFYFDTLLEIYQDSTRNYINLCNQEFKLILDKFYWFGYLLADGWISEDKKYGTYRIGFYQKNIDSTRVKDLAYALKFKGKIYDHESTAFSYGKLIKIRGKWIQVGSKYMVNTLKKLQFLNFKHNKIGLPQLIKNLIQKAKNEAKNNKVKIWGTKPRGKMALSFLTGFYDGDGSYKGGNSALLINTNRKFLDDVKSSFQINNKLIYVPKKNYTEKELEEFDLNDLIRIHGNNKKYYIYLGKTLFCAMMEAYKESLKRKRPRDKNFQ